MVQTNYKRIPFSIELAKKIAKREIKGRIVTLDGREVRIVCWDKKPIEEYPIVVLVQNDYGGEVLYSCTEEGWVIHNHKNIYNLVIEIPTSYKDHSNFKPYKWQSCVVRDYSSDTWGIVVCCGVDSCEVPIFYTENNSDGYYHWKHFLPLSKITRQLVGTSKSYEQLCEELDQKMEKKL